MKLRSSPVKFSFVVWWAAWVNFRYPKNLLGYFLLPLGVFYLAVVLNVWFPNSEFIFDLTTFGLIVSPNVFFPKVSTILDLLVRSMRSSEMPLLLVRK